MILRWRRARRTHEAEINVTAFMNLMVVLTPFLLITTVFTQMAVQELNLPGTGAAAAAEPPPEVPTVIVRAGAITVTGPGVRQEVPATAEGHDLRTLSLLLVALKQTHPEETKVTVLLEPQVPYDTLIQVMDTVRYEPNAVPQREMFPVVSIGDAP